MHEIFDAHLHIIDPRFPLTPNDSYLPTPFTVADYLKRTKHLNIVGGAVVSGSFQAFDQTYLVSALKELGPRFVGVTQLPATTTDQEIERLHRAGVRAIRFNLRRGGSEEVVHLESLAKRVYAVGKWHVELYVDAQELGPLSKTLVKLPAVSIDHLGLSEKGLKTVLQLVEKGVKVKATGFGRVDFDVAEVMQEIMNVNEEALIFGTDLPSTRAPRPFLDDDIKLILETFDSKKATKILHDNGLRFYGIQRGTDEE